MGWGVLESRRSAFPRGTVRLGVKETNTNGDNAQELDNSKRQGGVVLSPQPSDDPNDPLNWWVSSPLRPSSRALTDHRVSDVEVVAFVPPGLWLCSHQCVGSWMPDSAYFSQLICSSTTVMLTPGLEPLTEKFNSNEGDMSTWILTAPTFWTSAAAFIAVAATDVWGRRPFYILAVAMMALFQFAGFFSTTFPMLAIARTAGGMFSAPLFTLLTATISDIFFVHQRGKSIAVWNLMLNSGAQVG